MLDRQTAAQLLQSPATTPQQLADIAAAYPDLHAQILHHPSVYPDLVAWINQVNAPNVAAPQAAVALKKSAKLPLLIGVIVAALVIVGGLIWWLSNRGDDQPPVTAPSASSSEMPTPSPEPTPEPSPEPSPTEEEPILAPGLPSFATVPTTSWSVSAADLGFGNAYLSAALPGNYTSAFDYPPASSVIAGVAQYDGPATVFGLDDLTGQVLWTDQPFDGGEKGLSCWTLPTIERLVCAEQIPYGEVGVSAGIVEYHLTSGEKLAANELDFSVLAVTALHDGDYLISGFQLAYTAEYADGIMTVARGEVDSLHRPVWRASGTPRHLIETHAYSRSLTNHNFHDIQYVNLSLLVDVETGQVISDRSSEYDDSASATPYGSDGYALMNDSRIDFYGPEGLRFQVPVPPGSYFWETALVTNADLLVVNNTLVDPYTGDELQALPVNLSDMGTNLIFANPDFSLYGLDTALQTINHQTGAASHQLRPDVEAHLLSVMERSGTAVAAQFNYIEDGDVELASIDLATGTVHWATALTGEDSNLGYESMSSIEASVNALWWTSITGTINAIVLDGAGNGNWALTNPVR